MNNLKLTVVTALSVLALTLSGTASANRGDGKKVYQQQDRVVKSTVGHRAKSFNVKQIVRQSNNKKSVKRVIVKHTPTKKIVKTRTVTYKPSKAQFVKNKRFNQSQRVIKSKTYTKYNKRNIGKNANKRYNTKRVNKRNHYSVRSGDTLIQISFKTGVSVLEIARLNRITFGNINHLKIGQKLRLS